MLFNGGDNFVRIGELARLTGKSVAALRYYERVEILTPSGRSEAGYRDYGPESVERVSFIAQAQQRGFALREIKTVFALAEIGQTPCPSVARAARRKVERLDKRIAQLQERRAALTEAVRLWECGLLPDAPFCPMLNASQPERQE